MMVNEENRINRTGKKEGVKVSQGIGKISGL
jgi:hypothetical protein